jgi:hypothetical protein
MIRLSAVAACAVALLAGCKQKDEPARRVASAPSAADILRVQVPPPRVGQRIEVTEVNHIAGTLRATGQETPMVQHQEAKLVEEILAVDGPVITRLKVTYAAQRSHEQLGEQAKKGDGPLHGKTFVIAAERGALSFLDDKGAPVAADVATELRDSFDEEVGRVPPMTQILQSKAFRPGERVELSPEEMKALSPEGERVKGAAMSLTLLERKGDLATLAFDGVMTGTQPGMTMDLRMKGTIKLEVSTARLLEMNLAGDMKGTGEAEFTGTMSGTKVHVYQ